MGDRLCEIFERLCATIEKSNDVKSTSFKFAELKRDSEKVEFCQNLISKYYNDYVSYKLFESCNNNLEKNLQKSVDLRNEGNKAFHKKEDCKALLLYTKCIAYAPFPNETTELSLGFGNRSAVLFSMGKFLKCLCDIKWAIHYGYPDHLKYKLLERKGKCLQQIGKFEDAEITFKEAICNIEYGRELSDNKKEALKENLNELLNSRPNFIHDQTDDIIPPPNKTYGQHKTIMCASDCLDLKYAPESGRYLNSSREILPGDVILVEKPYASILLPDCFYTHCYNCLIRSKNLIPCHECSIVMFCSELCRQTSWEQFHSIDCNLLATFLHLGLEKMEYLALRLVILASKKGKNILELQKQIEDLESSCGDECASLSTCSKTPYCSDDYLTIYKLVANAEKRSVSDLFRRTVTATCILKCLQLGNHFFSAGSSDNEKLIVDNQSHFIGGLILKHLQNLPCNAHEVSDYIQTNNKQLSKSSTMIEIVEIGAAAYSTLSLLNHSCDPNVFRHVYQGDITVLRAIRTIRKNEQIVDNYGYHYAVCTLEERQSHLKSQYYFTCRCEACQNDWPIYNYLPNTSPIFKCSKCNKRLNKEKGKCCDKIDYSELEKMASNASMKFKKNLNGVLTGKFKDKLFDLQNYLHFIDLHIERPLQEYNDCQEALKQCIYNTGNVY